MYESLKETLNKNSSERLNIRILPLPKTHIKKNCYSQHLQAQELDEILEDL